MKLQSKLVGLLLLFVAVVFTFLSFAQAGVNAQFSELPPRPTGVPNSDDHPIEQPSPIVAQQGGFIALSMADVSRDYWVVIQWLDDKDGWHTVSGWQGNFDHTGQVLWWVAPEDMGKGPFRWLVLSGLNGREIAASDNFDLPTRDQETVHLEITPQNKR